MKCAIALPLLAAALALAADEPAKKRPSVADQVTGRTVSVKDDDRTILITDTKTGKVLVSVNVIESAGAPNVGRPVVRDLSIKDGVVTAIYGKHSFARFDLKTGRLLEKGSD
jgi:hypothetical protein